MSKMKAIQGMELRPTLQLGVVPIEKGTFLSLTPKDADFTFNYY